MNVAVALCASRHGATVVNHVEVLDLIKEKDEVQQIDLFDLIQPLWFTFIFKSLLIKSDSY